MTETITPVPGGFQVSFDSGEVLRVAGGYDDLQEVLDMLENTPPEQRGSNQLQEQFHERNRPE